MKHATADFAVHHIRERIGVGVTSRIVTDGVETWCEMTSVDLHPSEGFAVNFRLGWRSAEAVFIPGPFAAPLIARMGASDQATKKLFSVFAAAALSRDLKVLVRVNGTEVNPIDPTAWPSHWFQIEIRLKKTPLLIEPANDAQHKWLVTELVVPVFGMVVTLIGAEEIDFPTVGALEGRAIQSISTRHERKHINREACIQLKGTRCLACGFDFGETYGALGIGYIEVHHLRPIASIGPDYRINIESDLVPLCSNCHSTAHREDPPVAIEQLRELIIARRSTANF